MDGRMRRVAERKQKSEGRGWWGSGGEGGDLSAKHIKTPFLDGRLWETQYGVSA